MNLQTLGRGKLNIIHRSSWGQYGKRLHQNKSCGANPEWCTTTTVGWYRLTSFPKGLLVIGTRKGSESDKGFTSEDHLEITSYWVYTIHWGDRQGQDTSGSISVKIPSVKEFDSQQQLWIWKLKPFTWIWYSTWMRCIKQQQAYAWPLIKLSLSGS